MKSREGKLTEGGEGVLTGLSEMILWMSCLHMSILFRVPDKVTGRSSAGSGPGGCICTVQFVCCCMCLKVSAPCKIDNDSLNKKSI